MPTKDFGMVKRMLKKCRGGLMFALLRKYFEDRKNNSNKRSFIVGFDYAAGVLLRGEETPMSLESYNSDCFEENSSSRMFDRGVAEATDRLCSLNAIVDDR